MTAKRFKVVITTYEDGKQLSKFTAPDESAEAAVRWVTERALVDAEWADKRAERESRYDERIVPNVRIRWKGYLGTVKKINSETLRATVRLDSDRRDVSIKLVNLEFVKGPEE